MGIGVAADGVWWWLVGADVLLRMGAWVVSVGTMTEREILEARGGCGSGYASSHELEAVIQFAIFSCHTGSTRKKLIGSVYYSRRLHVREVD